MPTHDSSTHLTDIDLYNYRAKNVDLIWCDQVINLLQEITKKMKTIVLMILDVIMDRYTRN